MIDTIPAGTRTSLSIQVGNLKERRERGRAGRGSGFGRHSSEDVPDATWKRAKKEATSEDEANAARRLTLIL